VKKIILISFLFAVVLANTFAQTTAEDWFNKADEYFKKDDYNNAIKAYNETLKRDNTNLNAYLFRGTSYYIIKNYDAAIADLNIVIENAPDFPSAYVKRGDAYGAKGIYNKALTDYKEGLELGYDASYFGVDKSNKADMWFCGAVYMEILINRFLGRNDAAAKYENSLKTVCDKNSVSRAEVEAFYRGNIRSVIADVVFEEFNKISFTLEKAAVIPQDVDFVLVRDPGNGKYFLAYSSVFTQNKTKIITGTSDDLLREMKTGKNKSDFDQDMIDDILTILNFIPTAVYDGIKQKPGGVDALGLITETLTNFFIDPARASYEKVAGIYSRYWLTGFENKNLFAQIASNSYIDALRVLSNDFANKTNQDISSRQETLRFSKVLDSDARYNIFSAPYTPERK
jgi:tetratricopeptide (TPR) repeat protein